ncbi:hypothetical protein B0A49_02665 [Cryomyces minteri]|uniref:LCCL domain-containing protein n=1 Tax=Cryomyces minteri TaxID=331657 RepID=A0A4U0XAA7_9PEZI|nr:hypothetical protein B0A49_02665 [Cryomyces minteri]
MATGAVLSTTRLSPSVAQRIASLPVSSTLTLSAIHAGFISNKDGGCGVLALVGEKSGYPAVDQYSIASVGFDSYFPQSFTFVEGSASECRDLRWPLLAVSVIFTSLLSVFTTSAALFFGTIFTALFFHVGLASDPPSNSDYYSIVSITLGRFLPAAFCAFAIYRYVIKRTFTQPKLLDAQIEKTVLWLGAAWVGALNNYTFDKIPIQRLTPHDLQQPGAITALVIIVLAILLIALGQAWALRVEGRMPRYLALYVLFGALLGFLVAIPNMNVRIHHYILALLLLPGTSLQNRPSLLYQGLLVGLFINGIARWGFDSILQTPAMLLGDGQLGTLLPQLAAPVTGARNITFAWQGFPDGWDGISVLVNDVERFRGYEDFGAESFTWERRREGLSEYFRFAFMSGSQVGDYTRAGIWAGNGSWVEMLPGSSR